MSIDFRENIDHVFSKIIRKSRKFYSKKSENFREFRVSRFSLETLLLILCILEISGGWIALTFRINKNSYIPFTKFFAEKGWECRWGPKISLNLFTFHMFYRVDQKSWRFRKKIYCSFKDLL